MMEQEELSPGEVIVFNWLTRHKIPFVTQVNMFGGVTQTGGAKVDFILWEHNIVIRVQSYWHTLAEAVARDLIQKVALMNEGYIVVDVWEEDLQENTDEVMRKAMRGIEVGTTRT